MAILLRVLAWNIAHASLTDGVPANSLLPGIADQLRAYPADVILLNEVKHWDLAAGGWLGGGVLQAPRLAELAGIPFAQWAWTVRTGWTGHIVVAVLSRYALTATVRHPILRGTEETGYATVETTFVANGTTHHAFSTRFDCHILQDNIAAHQQSKALVQALPPSIAVIFGGDLNASGRDSQFVDFTLTSGLTNVLPAPSPEIVDPQGLIDHILYRGSYGVRQAMARYAWSGAQKLSDHPWVLVELSSPPGGFTAGYRSVLKMKHSVTGNILHSHLLNYGHPGTSGQQQVTAFAGADDNDLWRVKGPHGQPDDFRAGQPVQHGEIIRLEHVPTGRNLHSHPGFPSPVTGQQEVTGFGNGGVGDTNDNWRIEIEGGGDWASGKRVRLIHVNTNHALHSHAGFSHPQWTAGQQEVTCFPGRDDNDWWYLFELR